MGVGGGKPHWSDWTEYQYPGWGSAGTSCVGGRAMQARRTYHFPVRGLACVNCWGQGARHLQTLGQEEGHGNADGEGECHTSTQSKGTQKCNMPPSRTSVHGGQAWMLCGITFLRSWGLPQVDLGPNSDLLPRCFCCECAGGAPPYCPATPATGTT